jgi:hypothetical protein
MTIGEILLTERETSINDNVTHTILCSTTQYSWIQHSTYLKIILILEIQRETHYLTLDISQLSNKGNNKITLLRAILQRESQNS